MEAPRFPALVFSVAAYLRAMELADTESMSLEQTFWIGALAAAAHGVDPEWEDELAELAEELLRRYRPVAQA
jgi:hypothetical protein